MSDIDPRRGFPSASAMFRTSKCPGSVALINALRASNKYIAIPNRYAPSGTKIHAYLALEAVLQAGEQTKIAAENLNQDEFLVATKCVQLRNEIVGQWKQASNGDNDIAVEKRIWYRQGLIPRFSGQPDFIAINHEAKRALIINYKTGRLEADPPADNLQLRAEVVLTKHKWPELEVIDAAIVEPLVSWDNETVSYSGESLAQAEQEILEIATAAQWPGARRYAGAWCTLCPARANCREALDYVQTVPNPDAMRDAIVDLPRGEKGSELWEKIKVAQKLLDTLIETYTRILAAEPNALPGYILPEVGRERRRIVQPAVFKKLIEEYLTPEEVDGCADYLIGKVEELIGIKHGINGKQLTKVCNELTQSCIDAGAITITHDKSFIRALTKKERVEMKAQLALTK